MKLRYTLIVFFTLKNTAIFPQNNSYKADSVAIENLNKSAYDIRLTDPNKSIILGQNALIIASKKGYQKEIAESLRMIGIGHYNLNQNDSALIRYDKSLSIFKQLNDIEGQARVYNNIGNLYREINYAEGLRYFQISLKLALKAKMEDLIGGTYLNIGIIYHRKDQHNEAIANFNKSLQIFTKLKIVTGQILCLQNKGVVYKALNQIQEAEKLLIEAKKKAKENKLNKVVASVNLTLTSIYIDSKQLQKAEYAIKEGIKYSKLAKNNKLERDFVWRFYELENHRKNYKSALVYFAQVYAIDSADFDNAKSEQIKLLQEQSKFIQKEKENQLIIERQKKNKILLIASIIVCTLAFILIFLLFQTVKKKAKTNKQLKILNEEISLQKETLNKVNQNLERIIDERTKDLRIKNRKLSEYSSHLSHQIRGPIATMKGLMILEKEKLIDDKEFIEEVGKCVNEIDDRIININDVLHNLSASGLIPKVVDKESKS